MTSSSDAGGSGVMARRGDKSTGLFIIVSSPSGTGKTSLIQALLRQDLRLKPSISMTTRAARPGETHGEHYFFQDHDEFSQYVRNGDMLEYARVFDHLYGTPRAPIQKLLDAGHDVICDVDWQGARQIRQRYTGHLTSIFLLPPSLQVLQERLHSRQQDSLDVIQKRLSTAKQDASYWTEYDHVVVNDDFDSALRRMQDVVSFERSKLTHRAHAQGILDHFLSVPLPETAS